METSNILQANVLDIIFDGKNKEYGAYQLRKTYNKRLSAALLTMVAICVLVFLSSLFANNNNESAQPFTVKDFEFEKLKEPEQVEPPPPPTPLKEQIKVEVAQFTPPKIVIDEEVKPDDELRAIEDLENVKVGTMDIEGVKEDHYVAPPVERSTGIIEAPKVIKKTTKRYLPRLKKKLLFREALKAGGSILKEI